jgi:hypothetical protein
LTNICRSSGQIFATSLCPLFPRHCPLCHCLLCPSVRSPPLPPSLLTYLPPPILPSLHHSYVSQSLCPALPSTLPPFLSSFIPSHTPLYIYIYICMFKNITSCHLFSAGISSGRSDGQGCVCVCACVIVFACVCGRAITCVFQLER